MMAIDPESVHMELSQPMNAQHPTENVKAAYIQAVDYKGGIVRLVRDTKKLHQVAGLDRLIQKKPLWNWGREHLTFL